MPHRGVAIRHRHGRGDRTTEADFVAKKLAGIESGASACTRSPSSYIFWATSCRAIHRPPANQTIYSATR